MVSGLVVATGFLVRMMWGLHTRLQRIENQGLDQIISAHLVDSANLPRLIDARLAQERHDNLYPMLQARVYGPIDEIEDELKTQGQNIAVLLERDRTGSAIERLASSILNTHATPAILPQTSPPARSTGRPGPDRS